MKVYELIQELVQFDADDEVSIRVNKADADTTCAECGEDITIEGETFESNDFSLRGNSRDVFIEVDE